MIEERISKSRLVIAAPKSGSGKTSVTLGLISALKKRGMEVSAFKCGPDYIDPLFHREILRVPSGNLDTFFTDHEKTKEIFLSEATGDISVIEGVMGLYDGVGGLEEEGSTYDLAKALSSPIILVLDAKGAGRSLLAELKGFLSYDKEGLIKGFILNKTSKDFGRKIGEYIESETNIAYLGSLPLDKKLELKSRHLGLVTPDAIEDESLSEKLDGIAKLFEKNIDIGRTLEIAKEGGEIRGKVASKNTKETVRIAVARDRAFSFYYRENLEMLESLGAEIIYFSPIEDKKLPEKIDALILGGGYPEENLRDLSENKTMLISIRERIEAGLPVLAECGGFLYLLDEIEDENDQSYKMAGVIKGKAYYDPKEARKRFGYITLEYGGRSIKGHEFHYFDTDNNGNCAIAKKPDGSKEWKCMHIKDNIIAGFPHIYYPSDPKFAEAFIEKALSYRKRQNDF